MINKQTSCLKSIHLTQKSKYGRIACIYDFLGQVWTFGKIKQSKIWHAQFLKKGDRVLFAGCGTGEEALTAAKGGVHLVLIDHSEEMISLARNKFRSHGVENFEFIHGNIMDHEAEQAYDMVVANYIFDVFDPATMEEVLKHLTTQVKEDGLLSVSGFAPVKGWGVDRWIVEFFHGIPILIFSLFLGNALHKIYDYEPLLDRLGFNVTARQNFYLLKNKFPVTHSILALKNSETKPL